MALALGGQTLDHDCPVARTIAGGRTELTLCECEKATGAPNGLSCEKEGWFVSNWEREGSWVRVTHLHPLTPSINEVQRAGRVKALSYSPEHTSVVLQALLHNPSNTSQNVFC